MKSQETMSNQELKEFNQLKIEVRALMEDIEIFNFKRKELNKRKKDILKRIDELEAKYEASNK